MILYLDTSSLVKLHLDEAHADEVRTWVEAAATVATSEVALPEAAAALAARQRNGDLSAADLRQTLRHLHDDWQRYAVVRVDAVKAARLAVRRALRGFDAVHLAAALTIARVTGPRITAASSFDTALIEAMVAEGLAVIRPRGR